MEEGRWLPIISARRRRLKLAPIFQPQEELRARVIERLLRREPIGQRLGMAAGFAFGIIQGRKSTLKGIKTVHSSFVLQLLPVCAVNAMLFLLYAMNRGPVWHVR